VFGQESLGFGLGTGTRIGAGAVMNRGTQAPKLVFGVGRGLDMLGRGARTPGSYGYPHDGENEDANFNESESEFSDEDDEAEVQRMLGD